MIRSADIQWIVMSCEDCDAKFSILKRRKTCCDCSYDFCTSCVSRIKGIEKRHQCHRCRVFSSMPCDRNAVMGLKIRHLRWFLSVNAVPMNGCKEKSELVDLVINHLRFKEAASQYPQNFERRTVAPEYLTCDSPVGSSESSPMRSLNSHSHHPGPSSVVPDTNVGALSAEGIYPDDVEDSFEIIPSSINFSARECESPSQDDEVQIIAESPAIPNVVDVEVHHVEEDPVSQHESVDTQAQQQVARTNIAAVSVQDLENMEDIDSLSVMQLKLILTRNFINYKGCCEKHELQEKVRNLWTQKQKSKDIDSIPDENVCRICMEAAIDSVLLECGHVVTCTECGKRLHECPICRQYIVRVVHIFKA